MNRFTIYIYCDLVKILDYTHNRKIKHEIQNIIIKNNKNSFYCIIDCYNTNRLV